MFYLKTYPKQLKFFRHYSTLLHRIVANPEWLSPDDIKEILWTAIELRDIYEKQKAKVDNVKGARVLLLLNSHPMYLKIPALRACEMLDVKLDVIIDVDWDTRGYITDALKNLAGYTDLILTQCKIQCLLDVVTDLKVPMFACKSRKFKSLQVLADFMTIQQKYGHLHGLKVAWLGLPNRVLNTYLTLGSKLGINISYFCSYRSERTQSPVVLQAAKQICEQTNSVLEECSAMANVLKDANVIVTSKMGQFEEAVTFATLEQAGPDCTTIFHFPRASRQIDDAVVVSNRCLSWESVQNTKWIFAAIVLRLLSEYKHTIDMPKL